MRTGTERKSCPAVDFSGNRNTYESSAELKCMTQRVQFFYDSVDVESLMLFYNSESYRFLKYIEKYSVT
jgi:hypothetical protein